MENIAVAIKFGSLKIKKNSDFKLVHLNLLIRIDGRLWVFIFKELFLPLFDTG
jgi:hypothetical protein